MTPAQSSQGLCLRLCWATFPRDALFCGLAMLGSGETQGYARYCPIFHILLASSKPLYLSEPQIPHLKRDRVVPTLYFPLGGHKECLSKWKVDLGKRC